MNRTIANFTNDFSFDIFISYSHKDLAIAESIYEQLTSHGFKCFFDQESIKQDFWPALVDGISNSIIFLYLGSKNTAEAKITPKELGFAIECKQKDYIYPYFIDDSELTNIYKIMLADITQRRMSTFPVETKLIPDLKQILKQYSLNDEALSIDIKAKEKQHQSNEDLFEKALQMLDNENIDGATQLLEKSCTRGHAESCLLLGQKRKGVNNEEAYYWLNKAKELSHPDADKELADLHLSAT